MDYKPHIKKVKQTSYWTCSGHLGTSPSGAYRQWLRWRQQITRRV